MLNNLENILKGKKAKTVRCHGKFKRACFFGEETNVDGEGETNNENDGNKVIICHIPPGNPDNKKSLDVGRSALTAHLRHGDTKGFCKGDEGEGDDETAPVISDISFEVTDTTAIITWTTDEDSDSTVDYADETLVTANPIESSTDATMVISHSIEITGLTAETIYYFTVGSTDASNNNSTSDENTFTTVAE
ncbi:fibronectin type III domain-containing protein [Patescibacteria group bacterium]|nr:fibronectin type III domain-containing protein [Patescibacteria group bacterium]